MTLYYRIRNFFVYGWDNFRRRCQRFKRGYAWVDVWNMEDWFMRTVKPMLIHLKENGMSYPMEFTDRDEWCAVLDEMIACLDLMEEDKVYEFLGFVEYEDYWRMTTEDRKKAYEIMENNKNRFFELFSKHFYDLWD
jgi:hypothetical protein